MVYLLAQPVREFAPYVHFKSFFTPEECDAAIALGKTLKWQQGKTDNDDEKHRTSDVAWVRYSQEVTWLFEKLARVCDAVRLNWYPFHLSGMGEPLQLTRYRGAQHGHYDWHNDFGPGVSALRKLSLTLQLSHPDDFAGGALELFGGIAVTERERGTVIAFPSWSLHRVTAVTQGERLSIVAWVHGPSFV